MTNVHAADSVANIPTPRILTVKSMRKHVLLYGFYDVVYEEDAEVTAQIERAFTEWTASAKIASATDDSAKITPADVCGPDCSVD